MDKMASGRGAVRPPMEGKWTFTKNTNSQDMGSATFSSLLCKIHSENEIATQQKSICSLIHGLNYIVFRPFVIRHFARNHSLWQRNIHLKNRKIYIIGWKKKT
jgi:hypothetical protein